MIAVARTLKRRLDNILTYLRHRITNALTTSVNAQVEKVKRPGPRLSQPHALPDRHLLSLRRPSTSIRDHNMLGLPTVIPDEPLLLTGSFARRLGSSQYYRTLDLFVLACIELRPRPSSVPDARAFRLASVGPHSVSLKWTRPLGRSVPATSRSSTAATPPSDLGEEAAPGAGEVVDHQEYPGPHDLAEDQPQEEGPQAPVEAYPAVAQDQQLQAPGQQGAAEDVAPSSSWRRS